MKHRLTLVILGAVIGVLFFVHPAQAHPADPQPHTPPAAQVVVTHTTPVIVVKAGDTLSSLVGSRWWAVASFNHLPNPNLIEPGQRLRIPPASYVPPPMPAPVPATSSPAPVIVAHQAVPPAQVAPSASPPPTSLYAAWTRVAICEEGGWIGYASPAFPNSLGIRAVNWYDNGGGSDVSPGAQIAVAMRLLGGASIPDQNGCQPGGW